MYSWVNILLEEAAFSRKKNNLTKVVYFTGGQLSQMSQRQSTHILKIQSIKLEKISVTLHQFTECGGGVKILNRYIHLFIYFLLSKSKLITCCFWYVGSIPTQGMEIKLLVLENIQKCISKYSYAVLYNQYKQFIIQLVQTEGITMCLHQKLKNN